MADKKNPELDQELPVNDFGSDFDFEKLAAHSGSSDDDAFTPPSGDGQGDEDFAGFSSSSASDADFGAFAGGGEPEFESPNVDDIFGSDDNATPYSFDDLPSPHNVESEPGDAHADFADFAGGDDDAPAGSYGDPFEENGSDDYQPDQAAAGPFDDSQAHEEEQTPQASNDNNGETSDLKSKIIKYAMIAAVVGGVGYVGMAHVAPMFLGGGETVVAQKDEPKPAENFPSALPPISGSQQTTEPAPVETAQVAPLPTVVKQPETERPSGELNLALAPSQPAAEPATRIELPVVAQPGTAPVNQLPGLEPSTTQPAKSADPIDDLVGGVDRGGIAGMKGEPAPVTTAQAIPTDQPAAVDLASVAAKLDEVLKRVEKVEGRVSELAASFDNQVKAPSSTLAPATLPAMAASDGSVKPPLKPAKIKGLVLRGVSRDIAWISTATGVVEVKVGDTVEDAGVIQSFQNYRGQWIAVTDKGIILPR
jgi:hypothetical protein